MLSPTTEIRTKAEAILQKAQVQSLSLATAESCTGGLIAALFTSISGASAVFSCGLVTYSNESKMNILNVPENLLTQDGAVSESVAKSMAEGALATGNASISVAVTGIAGPNGGTEEKPVGLVHIAVAKGGNTTRHKRNVFNGDREAIRILTVAESLSMLLEALE